MNEPRRRQPEQQAPPVQRIRLRYAKRGRARFASHRDFGRALERALRRVGVPMAYTSGFTPHPRISYANAAPTGAASEAEYLELGLAEPVDPEALARALSAALPDGLDVVAGVEAAPGALADLLEASHWRVQIMGVPQAVLAQAVEALLAAESVTVSRMTKSGMRDFDARGAIISLTLPAEGVVEMIMRHEVPLVRPDDVLTALGQLVPEATPPEPAVLTRVAQGRWAEGRLQEPFG